MDWFLYDNGPPHERVKVTVYSIICGQRIKRKAFLCKDCKKIAQFAVHSFTSPDFLYSSTSARTEFWISNLSVDFNRFFLVEKCGIFTHCLYHDLLHLSYISSTNWIERNGDGLKHSAHAVYQNMKRHKIHDFEVSVAIAYISMRWVQVGLWTRITSRKSVKIRKICALGLWVLFHPDKILLIFRFSGNWWIKNLGPENEFGKRYFMFHVQTILCSNLSSFLTVMVRKWQAISRHFVKDRPISEIW